MTVHFCKRRCPQRAITAKTDSKWLRLSAKVRLWRTECVLNRHFCLWICCFLGLMWIFNTNHIKDRYYLPNSAKQSPLLPSSRTKETSLPFLNYSFSLLFLCAGSVLARPVLLKLCIVVFLDFIGWIPHVFLCSSFVSRFGYKYLLNMVCYILNCSQLKQDAVQMFQKCEAWAEEMCYAIIWLQKTWNIMLGVFFFFFFFGTLILMNHFYFIYFIIIIFYLCEYTQYKFYRF